METPQSNQMKRPVKIAGWLLVLLTVLGCVTFLILNA